MTISLVTDGMLCTPRRLPTITAPDGTEGVAGEKPTAPCSGTGIPTDAPPAVPIGMQATGPSVPTAPCGTVGNDPTITPPKVPAGTEGSETVGSEAPAIPGCPKGEVT